MKFSSAIFAVLTVVASAATTPAVTKELTQGRTPSLKGELTADSPLGNRLLSKARRLDEDNAVDYSWVSGYSLKFLGCFHVSQWNADADDEEDVRVMTKRLVRFRLCPTDTCSGEEGVGCDSGYGDYVLDMGTYTEAYLEAKEEAQQNACEQVKDNCGCDGDDNDDEEACENQCFADAGMDYCIRDEDTLEARDYVECAQYEVPEGDDDNRRRRLEDGEDEDEDLYYVGPYCASQGGSIHLGLFTDDTCSEYADDYYGASTFKDLSGYSLPYSKKSLVSTQCLSCMAQKEDNDDDAQQDDEASESCATVYEYAGKCESYLSTDYPNEAACSFMEGIKVIKKDGTVNVEVPGASKTASTFIGIFGVCFFMLGSYVYYLKSRLSSSKAGLSES